MNIYDTKIIKCCICGKSIGEVEFDSEIIRPKCGNCTNPTPLNEDKAMYIVTKLK